MLREINEFFLTMPVTGLPATVEKTLTALLSENSVSSWKLAGYQDCTVFVLRLKPAGEMSTNMADPELNRRSQVQYFRRKPPSQIRRDQQRAKQQQQQQQQQQQRRSEQVRADSNSTPELPCVSDTPERSTQDVTVDLHTTPAHADYRGSEGTCAEGNLQADLTCEVDLDMQQPQEDTEPRFDSVIAGFEASEVKNYVATLTDRAVQNRLRDQSRNKAFRKVVYQHSNETDLLLCESDDLVLECSCDSGDYVYWYTKQEEKKMLPEEHIKLAKLRKGKRIRHTKYAETEANALRQLHALHDLIAFYLG